MTELAGWVREFGFPVTLVILFVISTLWALRTFIAHFMASIREANVERREMVAKFTTVVENHISHNTEAINSVCGQLKEMASDHREFAQRLAEIRSKS